MDKGIKLIRQNDETKIWETNNQKPFPRYISMSTYGWNVFMNIYEHSLKDGWKFFVLVRLSNYLSFEKEKHCITQLTNHDLYTAY